MIQLKVLALAASFRHTPATYASLVSFDINTLFIWSVFDGSLSQAKLAQEP